MTIINYTQERRANRQEILKHSAHLELCLVELGDKLGKQMGLTAVDGMDALVCYLVNKHHWLPSTVRAMNREDLLLALAAELQ